MLEFRVPNARIVYPGLAIACPLPVLNAHCGKPASRLIVKPTAGQFARIRMGRRTRGALHSPAVAASRVHPQVPTPEWRSYPPPAALGTSVRSPVRRAVSPALPSTKSPIASPGLPDFSPPFVVRHPAFRPPPLPPLDTSLGNVNNHGASVYDTPSRSRADLIET